jgi:glyoxylase-like metal-dependent hydrolase (beta-lactamase superfamily II)
MDQAAESEDQPFGVADELMDGLFRVRLPLDFQEDHINVWVLTDGDEISIIDTGVGTRETQELWAGVLENQFADRPLRRVICTHWHPDHMGCSSWLLEKAREDLWITKREWELAQRVVGSGSEQHQRDDENFLRMADCDEDFRQKISSRAGYITSRFQPPPDQYVRFQCGDTLDIDGDAWQTILGEGHSPEHASLYSASRNVLIGGDMVLPDTATFVGIETGEFLDDDPIDAYLQGLHRLKDLPEDVLVLPSHGEPFVGLHKRIDELEARLHKRLRRTLETLDGTMSAAALVKAFTSRKPSASQLYLGIRSTVACLNYHRARQAVSRTENNGVYFYARA